MTQRIPDINNESMVAAKTLCTASGATLWSTHLPGELPTYRVYDHNNVLIGSMDQRFVNHLLKYDCIQQTDFTVRDGIPVYVYKPTDLAQKWYTRQMLRNRRKRTEPVPEYHGSAIQGAVG